MNIVVEIGDSDNKLTQEKWSSFVNELINYVKTNSFAIYGIYRSHPFSIYQNVSFHFEMNEEKFNQLVLLLKNLCNSYNQEATLLNYHTFQKNGF